MLTIHLLYSSVQLQMVDIFYIRMDHFNDSSALHLFIRIDNFNDSSALHLNSFTHGYFLHKNGLF